MWLFVNAILALNAYLYYFLLALVMWILASYNLFESYSWKTWTLGLCWYFNFFFCSVSFIENLHFIFLKTHSFFPSQCPSIMCMFFGPSFVMKFIFCSSCSSWSFWYVHGVFSHLEFMILVWIPWKLLFIGVYIFVFNLTCL